MRDCRFRVSPDAIRRLCFSKALLCLSLTSPSAPKTSKSRWNTSFNSRRQLSTRPAGTIINARFSSPREANSRRIRAVSIVLPRPTSSAIKKRLGSVFAILCTKTIWCGSKSIFAAVSSVLLSMRGRDSASIASCKRFISVCVAGCS